MLHYRAVARTTLLRALDIGLCILGLVGMVYTTALTMSSWVKGNTDVPQGYCDTRGH